MRRKWWIAGGVAAAAIVGAGVFIMNERSVEQPDYVVVERDEAIELRDYPRLLVAETRAIGARQAALNRGFGKLADYIFAKSRGGESIAMTAPVLNDQDGGAWRTRFVMPARYTAATLPAPGAGVQIETVPARRVAAIRFSGIAGEAALEEHERSLRDWIERRGLRGGRVSYAFYNSPFIPGPLRRNEVLIDILA